MLQVNMDYRPTICKYFFNNRKLAIIADCLNKINIKLIVVRLNLTITNNKNT
jgi:hypothetical protein